MSEMTVKALLFDIGEVVSPEQWHLFDAVERRTGRTIVGRGPLDPDSDPVWQRYLSGELSFTGYWAEFALANGYDDWRALFRDLPFDEDPNSFVHPEAERLIREAQAAGIKIGALTNDGVGINGRSFFDTIPLIAGFDAFADAQAYGGKPAPEAYLAAARALGVEPGEVVFLDDTTYCVDGARAVGMWGVLVDPMARVHGFDEARRLAGLFRSDGERFVRGVEATYLADDLERTMAHYDPDISIHWNGERVALGADEARRFHTDVLDVGTGRRQELTIRKRFLAATGDIITAEHESSYRRDDGTSVRSSSAESWTLRRGLIIEWRVHQADLGG
jgi:putative hydrolase of the HAD superfamily